MSASPILLDPVCGMAQALELRGKLIGALDTSPECVVDASKIERVATPCIQLLIAADRAARAKGGHLHITAFSPAFALACGDMGLAETLAQWSL